MKVTIYKQNTNMRYIPYMVHNLTVDICEGLCGKNMSPFFKIYEKVIKANVHPKCCPLSVSMSMRN